MRSKILPLIFLISCSGQSDKVPEVSRSVGDDQKIEINNSDQKMQVGSSDSLTVEIFSSDSLGYGFKIIQGGELLINQPHIPAIQGLKGFENEHEARRTADFMIQKIEKGILPPSISITELDSLGITIPKNK